MSTTYFKMIALLMFYSLAISVQGLKAQSADSRVCNCFTSAVSSDFMTRTKVMYGTIGLFLSRDLEVKPKQLEAVKFILPVLESKSTCRSSYSIYIADDQNRKVYELTSGTNEISYRFPECNRTYYVTLKAFSKSNAGGDGNCSRTISIKITPQCVTTVCDCATGKGSKGSASADYTLNGKVQAVGNSGGQNRYVIRFDVTNKSACYFNIQSLTVHGQTIEVPAYNTPPGGQTRGVSLGFSTPSTQAPPADTKVSVLVRYSLNGKKCAETIQLPYFSN